MSFYLFLKGYNRRRYIQQYVTGMINSFILLYSVTKDQHCCSCLQLWYRVLTGNNVKIQVNLNLSCTAQQSSGRVGTALDLNGSTGHVVCLAPLTATGTLTGRDAKCMHRAL